MLRDYLLQDYAITHAMATGYGPGNDWEAECCHECGEPLDAYDSYETVKDFYGNWYCPHCAKQWGEEYEDVMEEVN